MKLKNSLSRTYGSKSASSQNGYVYRVAIQKGAWFNLFLLISVVCHLTHVGEHPCTIGEDLRDSKSLKALFHALNNK